MPLPLILGIGAAIAGIAGIGAGVSGVSNMIDAKDTAERARKRQEANRKRLEERKNAAVSSADDLGKFELEALGSLKEFSEPFKKIRNKPEFVHTPGETGKGSSIKIDDAWVREIEEVSVGADALFAGLASAAAGVAGGFAAAGAVTAATVAFGTASTGAAISGLTGVYLTNATMAALGGGALAAGGGGIALGTTVLGAATLGVGLLVGGVVFAILGSNQTEKANEFMRKVEENEEKINELCGSLDDVTETARQFLATLKKVARVYRKHLRGLAFLVNDFNRTDWNDYSEGEKNTVKLSALFARLLYTLCSIPLIKKEGETALVLADKASDSNATMLPRINKGEIMGAIDSAEALLARLRQADAEDGKDDDSPLLPEPV